MSKSKIVKRLAIGTIAISALALSTGYVWLSQSKPMLEGNLALPGLSAVVTIQRDANGIPTITAQNRIDLARATGFIHGQERFYQMDLLRRNSAGELSELFGDAALSYDKKIRTHRFRMRAQRGVEQMPAEHLAIFRAYTDGVNAGLKQLSAVPMEYSLLGKTPSQWKDEDSLLSVYSMYLDLQEHDGKTERSLTLMRDVLPEDLFAFVHPKGGQWDAPIDGSVGEASPVPQNTWPTLEQSTELAAISHETTSQETANQDMQPEDLSPGSNNWAISGALTKYTSGMLADDMHLGIRVPNIWFRAHMKWQENGVPHQVVGLTLPGAPTLVVGSNTNIAWGFTNSYGDWSDVIRLTVNDKGDKYLTPEGFKAFDLVNETIQIAKKQPEQYEIKETIWGPVIGEDGDGNLLAYRWTAHDAIATNLNFLNMEKATSVEEALRIGPTLGMPNQNLVTADKDGNIGWTITSTIPVRYGFDGSYISDWSDGTQGWSGYLPHDQYPKVYNPTQQRIWTANSRVVGGEMYDKIGNGGYALGARAKQIRDDLFAKDQFSEQDLLNIQLDDRAVFLTRWHKLLLEQVVPGSHHPEQAELTKALQNWSARASEEDQGYLLVRQFRLKVRNLLFADLVNQLSGMDKHFNFRSVRKYVEEPMWAMITEQPEHLLPSRYTSWDKLLVQALNEAIDELNKDFGDWKTLTWGEFNAVAIKHPMSPYVPFLGLLTDMPHEPQAGDTLMPRVGGRDFGASQRIVVAPGHEDKGILHMPSSQAAHPLLPYFGKGHEDWLKGKATPLLPGETRYELTLMPN